MSELIYREFFETARRSCAISDLSLANTVTTRAQPRRSGAVARLRIDLNSRAAIPVRAAGVDASLN